MRQIIDPNTFSRRTQLKFFETFINPNIGITSEVECTGALARAKASSISFFQYYTYAILQAINSIENFRYRINKTGEISLYDQIDCLAIINTGSNGDYTTLRLPYHSDLLTFCTEASRLIKQTSSTDDPFAVERQAKEHSDINVIMVSALPRLHFTSISLAINKKEEATFPLITIGKAVLREGRLMMPVHLSAHHGLVDGFHFEQFFTKLESILK